MSTPTNEPSADAEQGASRARPDITNPRPSGPRLSVTVLNYNYQRYLGECITRILGQSFADFELFVIDDCSTDRSVEIVTPFLKDPRVRLIHHEQNRGFVESLIEGTEVLSRCEYVTVISADDLLLDRDAFRKQIDVLDGDPQISFCFSGFDHIDAEGKKLGETRAFPNDRVFAGPEFLRLLLTSIDVQILHSGTMIRSSAYRAAGGYRRDLSYGVDVALWMLLPLYGKVGYCASLLYSYRLHAAQMSTSAGAAAHAAREIVSFIDALFRVANRRGVSLGISRGDALRVYLPAIALNDSFAGRSRLCAHRLLAMVHVDPAHALSSRRFWIALARLSLGDFSFGLAHRLVRPLRR